MGIGWGIFKKWQAYMSGFGITLISYFAAAHNKSNAWIVESLKYAAIAFLVASIVMLLVEERQKRRNLERKLEEAINRDRPEVFINFWFGPRWDEGVGSIGIKNRGIKDAINVQILPIKLIGTTGDREETKEIVFSPIACLQRSDEAEYPKSVVNGWLDLGYGHLADYLKLWCSNWRKDQINFDIAVEWFDSSENKFSSLYKAYYSRANHKCRTESGFVKRVMPPQ